MSAIFTKHRIAGFMVRTVTMAAGRMPCNDENFKSAGRQLLAPSQLIWDGIVYGAVGYGFDFYLFSVRLFPCFLHRENH